MGETSLKIAILGGGAWGKTLWQLASANHHTAILWSRSSTQSLAEAVKDIPIIVIALSMPGVAPTAERLQSLGLAPHTIVVSATKGLESNSGRTPAQIWQSTFPHNPIVVLSGPNLSKEIQAGLPTASVVASHHGAAAALVQRSLSSRNFRIYTNPDPLGVELGGTLKNVIAIAVGVCDGLQLGANAKAALITRSLPEIIRIGIDYGAQPETFWGLSGLGDLLATCNSPLSRNYQVGLGLGQGHTLATVLSRLEGTAEGINTAQVLAQRSSHSLVSMPICGAVQRLLQGIITPRQALEELMDRDLRSEQ